MAIKLFAGTGTKMLADAVAERLNIQVEDSISTKFSDGEIRVELVDAARGSKAFVIQSVCNPVNDNLMELILTVDALKRASVQRVIAVLPYFPYARQDRRPGYSRVPISARVVADMMQSVGVDHVVSVDIHNLQIGGFFKIPFDNISSTKIFESDIRRNIGVEDLVIVSPDVGGTARARALAKALDNADLAIVDKRRPTANQSEVMNIIGDVKGKTCIIVDDMVDTAGTLAKAADALVQRGGAGLVIAYATHGVLSGDAATNIGKSLLSQLIITDSIPKAVDIPKVRYITIAPVIAETISRINRNKSISEILD